MDARQQAYEAGKAAHAAHESPLTNPYVPASPGDLLLARLWRAGWYVAKRRAESRFESSRQS